MYYFNDKALTLSIIEAKKSLPFDFLIKETLNGESIFTPEEISFRSPASIRDT
jgi:hypothetical protein